MVIIHNDGRRRVLELERYVSTGGTVTSVSANSLNPVFSTTVNTPNTTPSIVFSLNNAPSASVFGNFNSVSSQPSYNQAPSDNLFLGRRSGALLWTSLVASDIPNISETQVTNLTTDLNSKQNVITLTTIGVSGVATFVSSVLNIPNYTYTLPIASASVLGGIKVGSGLSIDGGGVLSATFSLPSLAQNHFYIGNATNQPVDAGSGITWNGTTLSLVQAPVNYSSGGYDVLVRNQVTGNVEITTISAGGGGTVTSVSASISGALSVSGSPINTSGTLAFSWQGITSQYVRGDGSLATFPVLSLTTTGTSGVATLVGNTLNIPDYTYTLPTASTSVLGGVKIDGTTITISGGVISAITGGSGTVTSFSSGSLSPLFTTSVSSSTSTPALSFTLSNAGANTYFGNSTGVSAAPSYISAGALTKTDDTNVTLSLGGNPSFALLQNTSLTLGWSGQLSLSRGGTGASLSDPNINALMAWDDTDGAVKFITIGSNLSYDHASHTLSASVSGGGGGTVTSVAASISGALGVSGSPITTSGTLTFSWQGTSSQYVAGDGSLVTFPSINTYTADEVTLHLASNQFSIKTTYVGQASITTLGIISTGTWQGTAIVDAYISSAAVWNAKIGGSGVSGQLAMFNSTSTITNVGLYPINSSGQYRLGINVTPNNAMLEMDATGVTFIRAAVLGTTKFILDTTGTITMGTWNGTAVADAYIASSSYWNSKQDPISLTTTGTSGASTFVGNVLNIPNYTYTLPTATTTVLGGVKVDGSSITIAGGTISATPTPEADVYHFESLLTAAPVTVLSYTAPDTAVYRIGTVFNIVSNTGSLAIQLQWTDIRGTSHTKNLKSSDGVSAWAGTTGYITFPNIEIDVTSGDNIIITVTGTSGFNYDVGADIKKVYDIILD